MLYLDVVRPDLSNLRYLISDDEVSVGRGECDGHTTDIVIAHPSISRQHAILHKRGNLYAIKDAGSTNHTWVNGNMLDPGQEAILDQHSYVQLGEVLLLVTYSESDSLATPSPLTEERCSPVSPSGRFRAERAIVVGRSKDCEIIVSSPQVSLRHASLQFVDGIGFVRDLGSQSGTYVNGEPIVRPTPINPGDTVMVGMTKLQFDGSTLVRFEEQGTVRIDALGLSKTVTGPEGEMCILRNISLQIRPRELVAIVGQSGSGKSTLMKALCGYTNTTGSVRYNGWDLSTSRPAFAGSIGYVPQEDIIHSELTISEALMCTAELRLPSDLSNKDRLERVENVLKTVDLWDRRDFIIGKLSGGQRKRVNIGVELISDPSVLFLDEPASGLDPHMESQLMGMLRQTADSGRTVVMVTHATQSLHLADLVIFMGHGGNVCFVGTPDEALIFFECEDYASIYGKIGQTSEDAKVFSDSFESSEYAERNVKSRLREYPEMATSPRGVSKQKHWGPSGRSVLVTQVGTLARRYSTIISRDSKYMALLLLQSPVLAVIIAAAMKFDRYVLSPEMKGRSELLSMGPIDLMMPKFLALLLVVAAVWIGISSSAREIVKERSILRRERMVTLGIPAYLASKFLVLAGFAILQCILMIAVLSIFVKFDHPGFSGYVSLCGFLSLSAIAGMCLGLLVSSLASSSDQATSLVPLLVLPQLALCGALIPMDNLGLKEASSMIIANWGYRAIAQSIGIRQFYDGLLEIGEKSGSDVQAVRSIRADVEEKYRTPLAESLGVMVAFSALGLLGAAAVLYRTLAGY